ncbi:MAG: GTP cyclohydrolase I FolE [Caldisericia bacterium]
MFDKDKIKKAVELIIEAIGEDKNREGLKETPERIADMYEEIFKGLYEDAREHLKNGFIEEKHQEMVILRNISFFSMCEHHFLPFYGKAHVGYIPSGKLVGISKIARVVDTLAKKPQLQERLTSEIADTIFDEIKPLGLGVVLEAEHLCMIMRGIKKPGSMIVTSAIRGGFRKYASTRSEFLFLISRGKDEFDG